MPSIEERLVAVEAQLEIARLEGEYARRWDTGDAQGWAELFTEDGAFQMVGIADMEALEIVGQAALAEFCVQVNSYLEGMHLMHNPTLRIEGNEAFSWMHFEFRAKDLFLAGVYQITYAKERGAWRIKHRLEQAVLRNDDEFFGLPK